MPQQDTPFGPSFWNTRYGASGYVFGIEPNDFLREQAGQIAAGPILCLGEGEGRNAVHLARLGHSVVALDQSSTGLAKADELAAANGVAIETCVADLASFTIEPAQWGAIVSIFLHLPAELRRSVHRSVVVGLRRGGVYILEAYTPAQLAYNTGGPKEASLLPTLAQLHEELAGLDFHIGREVERDVIEGSGHTGRAAVVQVVAIKH